MGWTTQMAVLTRAAVKRARQGGPSGFQHEGVRCHLNGCQHAVQYFAVFARVHDCEAKCAVDLLGPRDCRRQAVRGGLQMHSVQSRLNLKLNFLTDRASFSNNED